MYDRIFGIFRFVQIDTLLQKRTQVNISLARANTSPELTDIIPYFLATTSGNVNVKRLQDPLFSPVDDISIQEMDVDQLERTQAILFQSRQTIHKPLITEGVVDQSPITPREEYLVILLLQALQAPFSLNLVAQWQRYVNEMNPDTFWIPDWLFFRPLDSRNYSHYSVKISPNSEYGDRMHLSRLFEYLAPQGDWDFELPLPGEAFLAQLDCLPPSL